MAAKMSTVAHLFPGDIHLSLEPTQRQELTPPLTKSAISAKMHLIKALIYRQATHKHRRNTKNSHPRIQAETCRINPHNTNVPKASGAFAGNC